MKTWSVPLAVEAVACTGAHTLLAPMSLVVLLVPMDSWGPVLVLTFFAASAVALLAYWQLALATITRGAYRFGWLYWVGAASGAAALGLLARAEAWWFWILVLVPPALSWLHFSYLQLRRVRHAA